MSRYENPSFNPSYVEKKNGQPDSRSDRENTGKEAVRFISEHDVVRLQLDRYAGEPFDYSNEEIFQKILAYGNQDDLEHLFATGNYSAEELVLFRTFAQLRQRIVDENERSAELRRIKNPYPTPEESNLGAYIEHIEPQVREAVLSLRRKGYNTYESGFMSVTGRQAISFTNTVEQAFDFPPDLINTLKSRGVSIARNHHSLQLNFSRFMDIPEMTEIWNDVAKTMPDLGHPAEPSQFAASFREEVEKHQREYSAKKEGV